MSILTGDIGKLKVGYQTAATLLKWTVTSQQETLGSATVTLVAVVGPCDKFWMTQRPIALALNMGAAWWRWETGGIPEFETGDTITIQLLGTPVAVSNF